MSSEYWTADTPISAPIPRDDLHAMEKVDMAGLAFTPVGLVFDYTVVDYDEIFFGYRPVVEDSRTMVGIPYEAPVEPNPTKVFSMPDVAPPAAPVPPERMLADLVGLGHYIETNFPPAKVSEHIAFGGVSPIHATGSPHYMERAIDVNAEVDADGNPVPDEAAILDQIDVFARSQGFFTLWQTVGHYDHLHIEDRR